METLKQQKTHTLINFRSPKHIHQSFDHICKLYSLNRSHVLNRLMIEYVVTETDKINDQISVTNSFKNNTSNFDWMKSGDTIYQNQKSKNLHEENQNKNRFELYEFYFDGGNE